MAWRSGALPLRGAPRGARGLTLVELLVALGLFLALSFTLYSFVRGGLRMWRVGERRMSFAERTQVVLDLLIDDLSATFVPPGAADGAPIARFLSDLPEEGEGRTSPWGSRLRFVRAIRGELYDPQTRDQKARALPPVPGQGALEEAAAAMGLLVAPVPGGLVEVAYTVAGPASGGPGTLYRGRYYPVGGAGSFFAAFPAPEGGPGERLEPVLDGVLRLSLRFEGQFAAAKPAAALPGTAGGLEEVWDSTRGLLRGFSLFRGPESGSVARDDVFPRAAWATLVLTRPGDAAFSTTLRAAVEEGDKTLPLAALEPLREMEAEEVLIEREWIRVSVGSSRDVKVVERGARGTKAAPHPRGAEAWVGVATTARIEIPCFREDWNR